MKLALIPLTLSLLLFHGSLFSQRKAKTDNNYKMWEKCVVNVEGRQSEAFSWEEQDRLFNMFRSDSTNKAFSDDQIRNHIEMLNRELAGFSSGTALYIAYHGQKYLLTAAHVFKDKVQTEKQASRDKAMGLQKMRSPYSVFHEIVIRRRFDSRLPVIKRLPYLTTLQTGTSDTWPIAFDESSDIIVVSLNEYFNTSGYAALLDSMGYIPVDISHFDTTSEYAIGSDIMCIGFPNPSEITPVKSIIEGSFMSLPIFSYGKIASSHLKLNMFWGDISIYPGNSGGPVIQNNKLIGIVSAQSSIPLEPNADSLPSAGFVRVPFGKMIKIKEFFSVLEELIGKEKREQFYRKEHEKRIEESRRQYP